MDHCNSGTERRVRSRLQVLLRVCRVKEQSLGCSEERAEEHRKSQKGATLLPSMGKFLLSCGATDRRNVWIRIKPTLCLAAILEIFSASYWMSMKFILTAWDGVYLGSLSLSLSTIASCAIPLSGSLALSLLIAALPCSSQFERPVPHFGNPAI